MPSPESTPPISRLTFEVGVPAVRAARREGLAWTEAAVEAYLALLATAPDTHIARKLGRPRP